MGLGFRGFHREIAKNRDLLCMEFIEYVSWYERI